MKVLLLLLLLLQTAAAYTTLVDLVAESPEHSLLLKALQKTRLIPILNKLNHTTLFAPTDDAIRRDIIDRPSMWTGDNLATELRETLLYHVLNYSLFDPTQLYASPRYSLEETLFFPGTETPGQPPQLPGSPPDDDNGHDPLRGLLDGQGQKIRLFNRGKGAYTVGADHAAQGGATFDVSDISYATHGVLIPVDRVLERPKSMRDTLAQHPELSKLLALLPNETLSYLDTTSHITLFAPTNDAWEALPELELTYLESGLASPELNYIVANSFTRQHLLYLNKLKSTNQVVNSRNETLAITHAGGVAVNGTQIQTHDILVRNGVIHTLPSLLLPAPLSMSTEKYLIALGARKFVSLLQDAGLDSYIKTPTDEKGAPKYTILALTDHVLSEDDILIGEGLTDDEKNLKRALSYHILPNKWLPEDLSNNLLLDTELKEKGLNGRSQKIQVSIAREKDDDESTDALGWYRSKQTPMKDGSKHIISFDGANVVSDAIDLGTSVVYLLSSSVVPPMLPLEAAVTELSLSTYIAYVYSAGLNKMLTNTAETTYLVPDNQAFSNLGLIDKYLLLPQSKPDLKKVLQYHSVQGVYYRKDLPRSADDPKLKLQTYEGGELYVEFAGEDKRKSNWDSNDKDALQLIARGPTINGVPVNGATSNASILRTDLLTSTGVLHLIDLVILPPDLDITIRKLLKGAKASIMPELLEVAGMKWLLDENREGYTLLCPSDAAFSGLNLTSLKSDPELLKKIIHQHIIKVDNKSGDLSAFGNSEKSNFLVSSPLLLHDEVTYTTLLDKSLGGPSDYGKLAFRKDRNRWLVGIKGATGGQSEFAVVESVGRATPSFTADGLTPDAATHPFVSFGGAIVIDTLLLPYEPSWIKRYGWVALLILIAITLTVLAARILFLRFTARKRHAYAAVEGDESDQEAEGADI